MNFFSHRRGASHPEEADSSSINNTRCHHYGTLLEHGTTQSTFAEDEESTDATVFTIKQDEDKLHHEQPLHEKLEENNECEVYLRSTPAQRAFPERFFALSLTLLLEIPVLLMISGGSDELCQLIGRHRYQLLIGFLPLTSAISGNVGLQASTLTTRAISHSHVTTRQYLGWLLDELAAALYLGLGMGCLLGSVAFVASMYDTAFGVTIFIAQVLSIVTAGFTGTLAPLIFSFLFRRDSGKWGGPLETAIQDIVGSFAMVVLSYHILKFLGPGPVDEFDTCGPVR